VKSVRTQVVIPSAPVRRGSCSATSLQREGVDTVILETRSLDYVQQRVRAGVMNTALPTSSEESGVGSRMRAEGLVHHGIEFRLDGGRTHRAQRALRRSHHYRSTDNKKS